MKKNYLIKVIIFLNLSFFVLKSAFKPVEVVDLEFPDSKEVFVADRLYSLTYKDIPLNNIDNFFKVFSTFNKLIEDINEKCKESFDSYSKKDCQRNRLKNKYFLHKELSEAEKAKISEDYEKIIEQLKELNRRIGELKVSLNEENEIFRQFLLGVVDLITMDRLEELEKKNVSFDFLKMGNSYIESNILNKDEKVFVIGDIHGNLKDLTAILYGFIDDKKILGKNFKLKLGNKIVFLGDIVDRGRDSLGCTLLLMLLKYFNPEDIIWLRGNHEDLLGRTSDFSINLRNFLGFESIYKFDKYFKTLPCVQFLKTLDNHILIFNHGGWSSGFYTNEEIKNLFNLKKIGQKNILIDDCLLEKFTWNDIDFKSQDEFAGNSARGKGIRAYSAPRVLDDLESLSKKKCKVSKFCGHMHGAPKMTFNENFNPLEYTDGFMRYGNDCYNIYLVISAAIDVYAANGYILRESIKYFPSYLMINVERGQVESVSGCVKRSDNQGFIVVDVPNAKGLNFQKDVDLVTED